MRNYIPNIKAPGYIEMKMFDFFFISITKPTRVLHGTRFVLENLVDLCERHRDRRLSHLAEWLRRKSNLRKIVDYGRRTADVLRTTNTR